MNSLFLINENCSIGRKTCIDTFMGHKIHFNKLIDFKYRHDIVSDVTFDIFQQTRITMKKETHVNFLTDTQM